MWPPQHRWVMRWCETVTLLCDWLGCVRAAGNRSEWETGQTNFLGKGNMKSGIFGKFSRLGRKVRWGWIRGISFKHAVFLSFSFWHSELYRQDKALLWTCNRLKTETTTKVSQWIKYFKVSPQLHPEERSPKVLSLKVPAFIYQASWIRLDRWTYCSCKAL